MSLNNFLVPLFFAILFHEYLLCRLPDNSCVFLVPILLGFVSTYALGTRKFYILDFGITGLGSESDDITKEFFSLYSSYGADLSFNCLKSFSFWAPGQSLLRNAVNPRLWKLQLPRPWRNILFKSECSNAARYFYCRYYGRSFYSNVV